MSEVLDFINRVVERTHLKREMFADKRLPSSMRNLRIIPFFGDAKSEFVLSTMLLPRLFPNDYVIVCSWPGHFGIYSGIGEFWSPQDDTALGDLARSVYGFGNTKLNMYERLLLRYFDNVTVPTDFASDYYWKGFTSKYFAELHDIEYVLPAIPSVNMAWTNMHLSKNVSVFLTPSKFIHSWEQGREKRRILDVSFWKEMIQSLLEREYQPVVAQDYGTYDLSPDFATDCLFISERNLLALLGVMRACDCVIDVFNGLSRYAMIARCPYLVCDERQRYFNSADYILDDLCGEDIPNTYLFSFAPAAEKSASLLVEAILNRLTEFIPTLDRDAWPSTVDISKRLSYDKVRKREIQRIGARFITVPKIEEE